MVTADAEKNTRIKINCHEIKQMRSFKCLRGMINNKRVTVDEINERLANNTGKLFKATKSSFHNINEISKKS